MPDVRMPDGTIIRNVPEGATREQIQAAYQKAREAGAVADKRPKSFWRGFTDELGNAASNAMWLMDTLQGRTIVRNLTGQPTPSDLARAQVRNSSARSKYQGSTAGKIAGGVIGSLPTAVLPGGALAQGAAGGALLTKNPDDSKALLRDAAVGAAFGKVGEQVGKRIVAPVAERVGRTAPVRAVGEAANRAVRRATGRNIVPPKAPRMGRTERVIPKAQPELETIRRNMTEARDLGLPFSLADADPRLRDIAGSATRFSPEARALAERTLNARALGQADRAVNGIDTHLAPITNINQRATDIIEGGKPVYGPLYEQAYAAPPITSPRLEQVLRTPAGRQATARANTIAANEFRDPKAMGFAVDDAGKVVLNPVPVDALNRVDAARQGWDAANAAYESAVRRQQASLMPGQLSKSVADAEAALQAANSELDAAKAAFLAAPKSSEVQAQNAYTTQSLDYVKRGIDDILEPQRNPFTGKLNLDEGGRAINNVQRTLINEVDTLNPAYRQARDAYAGFARQAEALRTGHEVLPKGTLPQRDFDAILSRADEATLPEYQRGFATNMADVVDRQRLSSNPYNAIYGSTTQKGKVAALFPEGAEKFDRLYNLEGTMADTRHAILGNSRTQKNAMDDQLFQNDAVGPIVDAGIEALSGGGVPGATGLIGKAARYAADRKNIGLFNAQKKATEMAPALFDTNPQSVLDYLDRLARERAEMELRRNAYARTGALLGLPGAAIGVNLGS